jgi:hypothetical protein
MKLRAALAALMLLVLGAVVFTGGATGDGGRGASAWAFVDPAGPSLVAERTQGFASVTSPAKGIFCLAPSPGIRLNGKAPVASEEAFRSYEIGWPLVRFPPANSPDANCAADELEVKTFNSAVALSNQIAFTVVVP